MGLWVTVLPHGGAQRRGAATIFLLQTSAFETHGWCGNSLSDRLLQNAAKALPTMALQTLIGQPRES